MGKVDKVRGTIAADGMTAGGMTAGGMVAGGMVLDGMVEDGEACGPGDMLVVVVK